MKCNHNKSNNNIYVGDSKDNVCIEARERYNSASLGNAGARIVYTCLKNKISKSNIVDQLDEIRQNIFMTCITKDDIEYISIISNNNDGSINIAMTTNYLSTEDCKRSAEEVKAIIDGINRTNMVKGMADFRKGVKIGANWLMINDMGITCNLFEKDYLTDFTTEQYASIVLFNEYKYMIERYIQISKHLHAYLNREMDLDCTQKNIESIDNILFEKYKPLVGEIKL